MRVGLAIFLLCLTIGCKGKDEGGSSGHEGGGGDPGQIKVNDPEQPIDDGAVDNGEGDDGAANAIPLENVSVATAGTLAVGFAQSPESSGLNLTEGSSQDLARITNDGKIVLLQFQNNEGKGIDLIATDVISLGEKGDLLRNLCGLAGKCYNPLNDGLPLVWLTAQGKLVEIQPPDGEKGIANVVDTTDGGLWAHIGSAFYRIDLGETDLTFVRVTDEEQSIDEFLATSASGLYVQGRVNATGASFSRRIKDNLGFENLPLNAKPFWAFTYLDTADDRRVAFGSGIGF